MITTSLLCIVSLLLPTFMQKGQLSNWGILVGGIFIFPLGIVAVRNRKIIQVKTTLVSPEKPLNQLACSIETISEVSEEVGDKKTEMKGETEVSGETQVNNESEHIEILPEVRGKLDDGILTDRLELSLEETLEKGFQAKESRNYPLAADWFSRAIKKKPSPDITFYLIIDMYWLWKTDHSVKEAFDKVKIYIEEYIKVAPPEWRIQLMEWVEKENILDEFLNEYSCMYEREVRKD